MVCFSVVLVLLGNWLCSVVVVWWRVLNVVNVVCLVLLLCLKM